LAYLMVEDLLGLVIPIIFGKQKSPEGFWWENNP
jgi:hypothetical protein